MGSTSLSQAFSLAAASKLSFDAAFLAFDYLDYNDDAYVKILGLGGEELLFASSVAAVGDQGHTSWAHFTRGPLAVGNLCSGGRCSKYRRSRPQLFQSASNRQHQH